MKQKAYFIGIGGIGVSALARYYLNQNWEVFGSDLAMSEIIQDLKKLGIKIFIGKHKSKNLPKDVNLVIYSQAIRENNPELKKAYQLKRKNPKLRILNYPQALGELTKKYFTIAISGSHGKSTVTAMIGLILRKAKLDPTVILGTKLKEFKDSNCRVGKSKYLVIEADEYKEAFLNYFPKILVILNIEYDHPDYFKTFKRYILAYKKFISNLAEDGVLIINKEDNILRNLSKDFSKKIKKIIFFSSKEKKAKKIKKLLRIPGKFNISNAIASFKVAQILKIPEEKIIFKALSEFKGTWRRFEIKRGKINNKKFILINDYGHHPTQIRETLKAVREKFSKRKIIFIYQPHQYQRTYYLWKDFIKTFRNHSFPLSIITNVYEVIGRENKMIFSKKASSKKLVKEIDRENVKYLPKKEILNFLKENVKGGEVIVLMGAGDIYDLSKNLT